MKKLSLVIFILFANLAKAATVLEVVNACIEESSLASSRDGSKLKIQECYNSALVLKNSSKLTERAAFLSSLILKTQFEDNEDNYQYVFDSAFPYYSEKLRNKVSPKDFKKSSQLELLTYYKASSLMTFYSFLISKDISAKKMMMRAFNELVRQNWANEKQAQEAFLTSVRYHDWKTAQEITTNWPQIKNSKLPKIVGDDSFNSEQARYFDISSDGSLHVKAFSLSIQPQIILVAGCHFATDAIKALSSEAGVSEVMTNYGLTIAPPDDLDLEEIDKLNNIYPAFRIRPVVNSWAWWNLGIKTDSTPMLYFIKDGKTQYKYFGAKNIINEFCNGIRSIGVPLPRACLK